MAGHDGMTDSTMTDSTAAPFVPDTTSLRDLASAAGGCQGCPLWGPASVIRRALVDDLRLARVWASQ